jgi:transcriptional regulator with XRE-family HTH domain
MAPKALELPPPERLVDVIADQVTKLRKERGITAQRLADELNKVGVDWTRDTVTKFETRRRGSIDVTELFALALVLNVPPTLLIVPSDAETVPVVPIDNVSAYRMLLWLLGEYPLPDYGGGGHWLNAGVPIRLVRRYRDAEMSVANALSGLADADYLAAKDLDAGPIRDRNAQLLTTGLQQLRQVRAEMKGYGIPLPQLPDALLAQLVARDITWED